MSRPPLPRSGRTWLPAAWRESAGRMLGGPPPGPVQRRYRAAIFQLDRLGDFVLALSAVRTLLAAWGEENCLLVVSDVAAPLAAAEFPRTPRIELPVTAASLTRELVPIWWRHRRRLAGIACDEVICLSHHRDLYKATALSWISTGSTRLLDYTGYPTAHPETWSLEIVAHRALVSQALGRELTPEESTPRIACVTPVDGAALLVCPFASERDRTLPESILVESLVLWSRRGTAPIVLSGTAGQAGALARLAGILRPLCPGRPIEIAARDTFAAFLDRLAAAGAVLATESGPAHLATALDKRAVIVVGGGTHGLCAPWRRSGRQTIAEHRTPCYHCGWKCTVAGVPCLSLIPPGMIAEALTVP